MYTLPPDLSAHVLTQDCSTASEDFSGRGVHASTHTPRKENANGTCKALVDRPHSALGLQDPPSVKRDPL